MSGFQSPNYTQTPNDLFDHMLPEMGLAELKVVLCIIRHTFGFHKEGEEIKLSIRAIARFTGLRPASVMDGATQAEAHGMIERRQEGNKTTYWRAVVSVTPSVTPRDGKRNASVPPSEPQLGVKESKENNKESAGAHKLDLVDMELSKLPAMTIRKAIHEYFRLNINWDTKTSRQWMEWAMGEMIMPDQIKKAAEIWRSDKLFNWQQPSLKGIFEKWPQLLDAMKTEPPRPQYKPIEELQGVPNPNKTRPNIPRS